MASIPPPVSHVLCSLCPHLTGTPILLPTRPLPYFPRPISPHAQAGTLGTTVPLTGEDPGLARLEAGALLASLLTLILTLT